MVNKIFIFITVLLMLPSIHALQMLEPIMMEVYENQAIEIGTVAPGEYFLISFYLEEGENYDFITTDSAGANFLFFENTKKTKESIFTVVKIKEDLTGNKQVRIILKNTETGESTSAYLKMEISSNVISAFVLPYDKVCEFGKQKNIKVKIINKSITTKKITLSSNLPVTWFDSRASGKLKKEVTMVLQPNDSVDVDYSFVPKVIGEKNIELFIYTDAVPQNNIFQSGTFFTKVLFERNTEIVNIYIRKDLSALYAANLYNFPTFALNSIPVYFFNNIIRIISE